MKDREREAFIREILDQPTDQHFDRVRRMNACLVHAKGEPFRDGNGYYHPDLLEGCNVVRAYLEDLARDYGVDISRK